MSFTVQNKRSDEEGRRPRPESLVDGQLAVNTNEETPGVFLKSHRDNVVKIGPCAVGESFPTTANYHQLTVGEMWLDTTGDLNRLNVWDGSKWRQVKS